MRVLHILGFAIALGIACSSCSPAEPQSPTQSAPAAPASSGPTDAQRTSVQHVASIVAQHKRGIVDAIKQVKDNCSMLGPSTALCSPHMFVLESTTTSFTFAMDQTVNPQNEAFLGYPPEEIRQLTSQTTIWAGNTATKAIDARVCLAKEGADCTGQIAQVRSAATSLEPLLDGWGPYGVP